MKGNNEQYFKVYEGTPRGKKSSVRYSYSDYRLNKAKEQIKNKPISVNTIIKHVNNFLKSVEIATIENPRLDISDSREINYKDIKQKYGLSDKRDIVWMKFTTDGYLGIVATSSDINFDIPKKSDAYNEKLTKYKWRYNTSGILVHQVNKKWDTSFVLVFPLRNIPKEYSRGDIEKAVGNYLIAQKVPIIDFYSHNY
ncbi:hypothetical protein NHG32_06430 [Aerococcaceae bacterium NML191219]|nr:hypothetical protein [Aerococcaceae bacterium NML191219]